MSEYSERLQLIDNLALYTPDEMGRIDAFAARFVPISTLMDNAGRAVARVIRAHFKPMRVLVLCGPGNNGGDGYVAARYLREAGWPVRVAALSLPANKTAAAEASACFTGIRVPFSCEEVKRADLVVDAVFGAGLTRDITEEVAHVLGAASRIVAIDIPSGVDGATGHVRGYASQAEMTVTFDRLKYGHLLYPGRELCGKLVLMQIGIPEKAFQAVPATAWQNNPRLWSLPVLGAQSNKYTRGVVSICGGEKMPGAARLCASAARATGAGLVRIAAGENAAVYRLGEAGVIVDSEPILELLADKRRFVWVCGPGLSAREVEETLPHLLEAKCCVLADAGALSATAGQCERLRGVAVITPHVGEFTRLFGAIEVDLPAQIRAAASHLGAVVVLKGASTLIAAPDRRLAINTHATPVLSTAGSGDTLSGVIAAFLAAGMPAWEAACAGVWIHGEAGIQAGMWSIAEKIEHYLGEARQKACVFYKN